LTFIEPCDEIVFAKQIIINHMLKSKHLESLNFQELQLYPIQNRKNCSQLKKIHNCFAIYINSILEDLNNDEITHKVILFEGWDKYDGQRLVLMDFINQIKYMINDKNTTNEQKNQNITNLRELINNLSLLKEISPGLIIESLSFLDSAESQLNVNREKPAIKIKRYRSAAAA
jgi:hypothetical protein